MDPGFPCHGMKANPIGYLWSKYECFLTTGCQDIDFYKTLTKWNGNTYDWGDYNSSFALRAVKLKTAFCICEDADQPRGNRTGLVVRALDSGSGDPG